MQTTLKFSLFSSFVLLATTSFVQAQTLTLVENQKPQAQLVIAQDATQSTRQAAQILQQYIEKSTSAKIALSNKPGTLPAIHIGETAYTKAQGLKPANLDEDGFIIKTVDKNNLVIVGGSDWGTEFGVYDFLERFVGVRWLAPGELFTEIPTHNTITIPHADIQEEPVYLSRQFGAIDYERDASTPKYQTAPWKLLLSNDRWGRFNRLRPRMAFHHNISKALPVSLFGKTHPEFYPMVNGQRYLPANDKDIHWQPNFSAAGIVDATATQIEKYFTSNPHKRSYSLGINDSQKFDQSPETLKKRKELGGLADEYAVWANEVAEKVLAKYPDKYFGFLAYIDLRTPPVNHRYHPHVVPFITYELSRWTDERSRNLAQNLALQWQEKTTSVGWYDYFYGHNYMVPRAFTQAQRDSLRWLAAHNVRYYYGETNLNSGEGPKDWLQSKLLWNPNRNIDPLLNDWYVSAVGKAAAPSLKAYYDLWEKYWIEIMPQSSWYNRDADYMYFRITNYLLDVPQEYITLSDQYFADALRLAEKPIHKTRIEKLHTMWKVYKASIITRQNADLWKTADLQSPTDAIVFLEQNKDTIRVARQRLQLLSDLRNDELYALAIYRLTILDDMRGDEWGSLSLWSLLPWVNRSQEIRSGLQEIAGAKQPTYLRLTGIGKEIKFSGNSAVIATDVLKAADSKTPPLMDNASFEQDSTNWQFGKGSGINQQFHHTGQTSVKIMANETALTRKIPYEAGTYYATFHAYTPQKTGAKASLKFTAVNQLGRQRGRNLPQGTITLHPGKWSSFVVPLTLLPMNVNDTMSLQLTLDVEGLEAGQVIYIDDVELHRVG